MGKPVELLLSQDPTPIPKVEVQILNQSQAEIMGIKGLNFANDREVVVFKRDGKDQILEADILPDIDIAGFLHDGNYMNEVLLKAEEVLKDSGK